MYLIDFDKPLYTYFIGIGGISMSGLAEILMHEGFRVGGSDIKASELTDTLAALGAGVDIGHSADHIDKQDLVVYTAAISDDNPELTRARELGIPLLTRAELLGEIMANYSEAVNVAGTHGKTTTTSMITDIVLKAGEDPTVTIGGMLDDIGGNVRIGGREIFIAEACEYKNSFLDFHPTIAAVLNVEADHLDFFHDIDDVRESFRRFILTLPEGERGYLVIGNAIRDLNFFTEGLKCPFVTFGLEESADYRAKDLYANADGLYSYTLIVRGREAGRIALAVPGEHNVLNSLAAIAVGDRLNVPRDITAAALGSYRGTHRRFEDRGSVRGFRVIDDYAHHPQEIEATLKTAALIKKRRLFVIFQPHTYSRTKALMDDFARVLSSDAVDEVIMAKIYAAREKDIYGVSSGDLKERINEEGGRAVYIEDFKDIEDYVLNNLREGDLLITMGAGNVVDIADDLTSMDLSTLSTPCL